MRDVLEGMHHVFIFVFSMSYSDQDGAGAQNYEQDNNLSSIMKTPRVKRILGEITQEQGKLSEG